MTPDILHPRKDTFAAGLSFVPVAALRLPGMPRREPAEAIVAICRELGADMAFVPAEKPWATSAVKALQESSIAPFWAVSGPLWPVIEGYGVTEGLRATLTRSEEVAERLEEGMAEVRRLITAGLELGVRAIVIAEDLAGSEGPLVAPDFVIESLMPGFGELVHLAATASMPVILHSDGDIRPLLGSIVRAGFSGIHAGGGLEFDAFERLFHAARKEGLVVIGGLQTPELSRGALAAMAIGSRAGLLGKLGGLILADDGGITEPAQVSALISALSAARDA